MCVCVCVCSYCLCSVLRNAAIELNNPEYWTKGFHLTCKTDGSPALPNFLQAVMEPVSAPPAACVLVLLCTGCLQCIVQQGGMCIIYLQMLSAGKSLALVHSVSSVSVFSAVTLVCTAYFKVSSLCSPSECSGAGEDVSKSCSRRCRFPSYMQCRHMTLMACWMYSTTDTTYCTMCLCVYMQLLTNYQLVPGPVDLNKKPSLYKEFLTILSEILEVDATEGGKWYCWYFGQIHILCVCSLF